MLTLNLIIFIAPVVITIAIILLYLIFISKLNLSEKTFDESSQERMTKQSEMKTVTPAENKVKPPQHYSNKSGNNSTPKIVGQAKSLREELNEIREDASLITSGDQKETGQSKDERKSFFLYGKVNFDGCKFKYGYLKTMPKHKPIPDECFGCPHILECVGTNEKKSDQYNSNKESIRRYYGY